MKKIIGIVCTVCLGIAAIMGIVCCTSKTVKLSGHITENGTTAEGNILVEHKRYNSLFGFQNIKGGVSVCGEDQDEDSIHYDFFGPVFKAEDWYMTSVNRYCGELNHFVFGSFFFDSDMKNVVLITDELEVIAAEDDFYERIKNVIAN